MRTEEEQKQISHHFKDINALKNAFMSFVRDGGVFIPTEDLFHLGDTVRVTLTLPQSEQVFAFSGEIIWITPKSIHSSEHHPGIGIQCNNDEGEAFQKAVQQLFVGLKDDGTNSETM